MGINNFFQIFVPKEKKFFPLFKEHADALENAANYLVQFISEPDPEKRQDIYKNIKSEEKNGDKLVYRIYKELNSSFITPFDREDIQYLASKIDDVIDYINGAANRAVLYRPRSTSSYFIKMAELVQDIAREIKKAMYELENIKKKPDIFEQISLNVCTILKKKQMTYMQIFFGIFLKMKKMP